MGLGMVSKFWWYWFSGRWCCLGCRWCCFGGCIGFKWVVGCRLEWVVNLGLVSKFICNLGGWFGGLVMVMVQRWLAIGLQWRDSQRGRKWSNLYYVILLYNLYYFIEFYIKIKAEIYKNKSWDIEWIIKWVNKINKIMFEHIPYVFIYILKYECLNCNWFVKFFTADLLGNALIVG